MSGLLGAALAGVTIDRTFCRSLLALAVAIEESCARVAAASLMA